MATDEASGQSAAVAGTPHEERRAIEIRQAAVHMAIERAGRLGGTGVTMKEIIKDATAVAYYLDPRLQKAPDEPK